MCWVMKAKKYIVVLLILAVCFSCIPQSAFAAVTQSQIDEVKRKRDQVYEEKQAQQQIIDELAASRDDIISEKMALEEKIAMTREQIALNNQEIDLYEDMIAAKQEEVVQVKHWKISSWSATGLGSEQWRRTASSISLSSSPKASLSATC